MDIMSHWIAVITHCSALGHNGLKKLKKNCDKYVVQIALLIVLLNLKHKKKIQFFTHYKYDFCTISDLASHTVNNLAAPIFMNVEKVKSFAYGVDFSPPLLQQMADLNKIIEDDDDALADRLFIIDKMFTYHCGTNMQNFIRFPAKILSKICDNA